MTMRCVPVPAASLEDWMIRAVKVKKDQLVERLEKNRATHEKEYLEAFAGFKDRMVTELQKLVDKARVKEP